MQFSVYTVFFFFLTQIKMHNFLSWLTFFYTIILHQDRQLLWWFYVFEPDTQFLYAKIGNLFDDF